MSEEIVQQIAGVNEDLFKLLDSFDDSELNMVPYPDSWTPGQVADHLTKSDRLLFGLLSGPTRSTSRAPDANIQMLSDTFLNFETKMKSPEVIIPDQKVFTKTEVLDEIRSIRSEIVSIAGKNDLSKTTTLSSPLGESTLLEILHFHSYHTQRHIHQLEKMRSAMGNKN